MSEQEKNNAIPTEGTVTVAEKKENFFKRLWHNPTVRKVGKYALRAAEGIGLITIGYLAGKGIGKNDDPEEDPENEHPAEEDISDEE